MFHEFHLLLFLPPAQYNDDQRGNEDTCPTHYDDDRNLTIAHPLVLVFAWSFDNNHLFVFGNSNLCRRNIVRRTRYPIFEWSFSNCNRLNRRTETSFLVIETP
mmetsp:Transcript_30850/g.56497  ORF Transcript_30850/g.56497 Transcript_30850/m.56497 type:complete len:103 (-) Transcript_30850:161-469(-)